LSIETLKTKTFIKPDDENNIIVISLQQENSTTFNLLTKRTYDNGRGKIVNRVNESFISSFYEVASKKFNSTAENYINKKGYTEKYEF